jgi:hypothetical protein
MYGVEKEWEMLLNTVRLEENANQLFVLSI